MEGNQTSALVWQAVLHFIFYFFGCAARGISIPQSGIKPTPAALEAES